MTFFNHPEGLATFLGSMKNEAPNAMFYLYFLAHQEGASLNYQKRISDYAKELILKAEPVAAKAGSHRGHEIADCALAGNSASMEKHERPLFNLFAFFLAKKNQFFVYPNQDIVAEQNRLLGGRLG